MPTDDPSLSRRTLLQGGLCAGLTMLVGTDAATAAVALPATRGGGPPIDRRALVSRHNVVRTASNRRSPLQVGNGRFAFGADVTGLQTFVPFNAMSQSAWHNAPLPPGQTLADLHDVPWQARDRSVLYDSGDPQHPQITAWAFSNPSRVNLGRIGLTLLRADGTLAVERDLADVRQELDLWTGTLHSRFTLDGQPVAVTTACHPTTDAVAVRIASPLVSTGRLTAFVAFPAPDGRQFAPSVGTDDGRFAPAVVAESPLRIDLARQLDADAYHVAIGWAPGATPHRPGEPGQRRPVVTVVRARYGADGNWLNVTAAVADAVHRGQAEVLVGTATFGSDPAPHQVKRLEVTYTIDAAEHDDRIRESGTWTVPHPPDPIRLNGTGDSLAFVVAFSPDPLPAELPDVDATLAAAAEAWPRFWQAGGAVDLSGSADPRWPELERRIVLSQYLMAANEAGADPPQESGLVNNGWFGKFHMEMYWWHAAHYALWNRWPLLDRSAGVYQRMLPEARARAARQGYKGARWTKMTGPDGRNSPFITNALLAWQQPHPMFFAELDYRAHPTPATLEKWRAVLFDAADFMASYAAWNPATKQFDLGPPMALVSENTDDKVTTNPTFELGYWRFGLRVALQWQDRLGLPRDANWERVLNQLAPLPVVDGVYVTYQGIPDMWTHYNFEHPALTGVFGWLPGDGVDPAVMRATLDRVLTAWRFDRIWGWDFPMVAMCAARLGRPDKAVDLLLTASTRFDFDDAGLANGGPFPYFPSNGGLLYAVAMMAAGWDGAPADRRAPGFPDDGKWVVRWEGLSRAI